jgi:hypothetical protein
MVRVQDYNNLNRNEKELLSKGFKYIFPFTSSLSIRSNEFYIKAKASELNPLYTLVSLGKVLAFKTLGWKTFTTKHNKYNVEYKCRPDGKLQISVDYPQEYLKYCSLIFKMLSFNRLSTEVIHTHPNAITSLKLDHLLNIRTRASIGIPEVGAGFKCKFNIHELSFSRYEIASWLYSKPRKMVAKQIYTGKCPTMIFDEVLFSYYEELNPKTHLAASARYDLDYKNYLVEVGIRHHIDEVDFFKAKLNNYGQFSLIRSHIFIIPHKDTDIRFQVSSSAQMNLINMNSDNFKLGLRLDLNVLDN